MTQLAPGSHPWKKRLAIGCLSATAFLPWTATAQDMLKTPHRSIRQPGHHPVDELDKPVFKKRQSHRGYEYRSDHFVVVSTRTLNEAQQLAGQLEQTWKDLGGLADSFTQAHRQPTFAIGAVPVFVHHDTMRGPHQSPQGPRVSTYGPEIILSADAYGPITPQQLTELKSESIRSFFRIAQLDQVLPQWAQNGIADFVAQGSKISADPLRTEPGPRSPFEPPYPVRINAGQLAPESSAEARKADAAWVRFYMTANDGQYAPAFLNALAQTIAAQPQEREMWTAVSKGRWEPRWDQGHDPRFEAATLLETGDAAERFQAWLTDPMAGQPIVQPVQPNDTQLVASAADAVAILKLMYRTTPGTGNQAKRPLILTAGQAPVYLGEDDSVPLRNLQQMVAEFSPASGNAWAVIDGAGSLILWSDRPRAGALIDTAQHRARSFDRDGQPILEMQLTDGRMISTWIEPETLDANRPTIRVAWGRMLH
jgi:hypothetical protein